MREASDQGSAEYEERPRVMGTRGADLLQNPPFCFTAHRPAPRVTISRVMQRWALTRVLKNKTRGFFVFSTQSVG